MRNPRSEGKASRGASVAPASVRSLGVCREWTGAASLRDYSVARLDQIVEGQAARTPEAIALEDESGTVTYATLIRRSRQLAHVLRARGVERDDLVAVSLERSVEQIVSILGVLLASAAYVPIDPRGPAERGRFMLEDARPRAIVTNTAIAKALGLTLPDIVVMTDRLADEPVRTGADKALPIRPPQDLAYVIYTSGSTGAPKGVLNQHDGVSNHLAWMAETFPLSTDDRVHAKTPAVFDVSVWEWFWPLSQGARLFLTRSGGEKDPRYLIDTIESQGITNIHFVPTLLRVFLERPDLDRCQSLRRVFCSGEALTAELRDRFFERMPGPPALINLYGPTETAVHVTGWVCSPGDTGPVPIGRPLPNVRVAIVDEQLKPVPQGVQGELLVGGVQVARGYLRRPELTRERFVSAPFADGSVARWYRTGDRVSWRRDGAIDFFGRDDAQVQLGGVRVELGEIEAALRLHPAVADAAVVVRETATSKPLFAYLRRARAGGTEPDPSVDALRRALADTLPDYMTPRGYVWLDDFPVTSTGKLDRRALPASDAARPPIEQAFEPPRAGTEARLARLWCDELQIDRVGRHDDFHLLGGDSLGTLRLIEAITDEFGIELPPGELLRSPTVALLAPVVETNHARPLASTIVALRAGNEQQALYLPPSMGGQLFYCRELVEALNPGRPVYGFSLPSVGDAPADLPSLAAIFIRDLLAFQPDGPYHLAGYSFSAALALEMAQQLRASGRTVGVLAMIDYGPGAPDSWSARVRATGYFLENLPYWLRYDILQAGGASIAARVRRKVATIGDRIRSIGGETAAQTAERAIDEMFDRQQLPEPYRRVTIDHLAAFYRYQPVVYDGRILLFWARCRPLFHSLTPALGWERCARGGFDRLVVSCNHDNILMPPHVRAIAAGLDTALTQWQRRSRAEADPEHRRT